MIDSKTGERVMVAVNSIYEPFIQHPEGTDHDF